MFFAWYRKADSGNAQVMTQELFRVNSCLLEADGKIQGSSVAPNGGVTAGEKNPGRPQTSHFSAWGRVRLSTRCFCSRDWKNGQSRADVLSFPPAPGYRYVCTID